MNSRKIGFTLAILIITAATSAGLVSPAGADHLVAETDGLVDSRCDNHSCQKVRLDDEFPNGVLNNGNNILDTIEVPGNAGLGLPDRLTWGGRSVCVEDFVAPGCAAGGDITAVVAGDGLTGGATFGSATVSVAAGGVITSMLADASVTTVKLADLSVTTPKIDAAAVTNAKLADGSVTANKILDGTVAIVDLAFDPGTQAELDAHKASADHDGRYFTRSELQNAGTINSAGNPVHWTNLQGVPAGLADGADADSGGDITAVNAGSGLTGGGTSGDVALSVNTATIQSRVTGSCAVGSAVRSINADGTVTCEASGPAQMVSGIFPFTNGGTHFVHPMDATRTTGLPESEVQMLMTRSAAIDNLRARVGQGLGTGHTTDVMLRKNGADTAISVSFVAGDGAGTQKIDGDAVTVAAGDLLAIRIVNSAGGSGGPPVSWSFDLG